MRAQEMYLFASLFIYLSGLLVNFSPPACENSAVVEFLLHTAERKNAWAQIPFILFHASL